MIETSKRVSTLAVALPTHCEIMVKGIPTMVRIYNAKRCGQIWAMSIDPAIVSNGTVDGITYGKIVGKVGPIARFDYLDVVEMLTFEGVI
jgi:hypothetical protein